MIKDKLKRVVWYKSIAFNIVFWFLPLTLIPILLISYDSNKSIINNIQDSYYHDIKQVSSLDSKFINNWFKYREIDIDTWSKAKSTKNLLLKLSSEYKNNSKDSITTRAGADLYNLAKKYDYIDDIFLLDTKGNILFSVTKNNKSFDAKFSDTFKQTLKDNKIHFSDLEFHKSSNSKVVAFFTAPITDSKGKNIGIFAIEIKLNVIYKLFSSHNKLRIPFHHYLVGTDSILRSKISSKDDILKLKISNKEFKILNSNSHEVNNYINPLGFKVFGIHKHIDILGVKWILVSEAETKYIDKTTDKIIYKALIYIFLTLFIVMIISFLLSKKIVKSILNLSESMLKYSQGREVEIDTSVENEVGLLATTFKNMMDSLDKNQKALIKQKDEANKTLEELEEQKYALDAHSIVAITNVKGDITFANDKFIEISGYSREELIRSNHRILNSGVHTKEYWVDMYHKVSSGKIWHGEVCNLAKDGSLYWVDTTIVPFLDENLKPKSYIAIRTDITDQKRLQKSLIESKELAEESVKAKSEFLASMSHEIRTPMNGVIGMLGLLMNTKLDESQKHQAYLAQSSAKALLSLINDILDFSKVEAGKLELEALDFDIRRELGDFSEAIAFRAQEKGLDLVLDVAQVDMSLINADVGRIRQILNNIVGNSIKFTSKGHILIKASLYSKEENRARLNVIVSDTGIGIPADKIDSLFNTFSQVDASTTRKYGGTGLGLAIVKKLCELMNGTVKVKSVLNEGSTFEIDIEVGLSKQSSLVVPPVALKNKKAIIIDANEVSTHTLGAQLEHWGMIVEIVRSSKEALLVMDGSCDIAFIDKNIQELNAQELAKRFKNDDNLKDIKLVIMTSVSDRGDINTYIKHGYDAYFPKPATTSDMFNSLNILAEDAVTLQNKEVLTYEEETDKVYDWPENTKILLVDDNKVNQLVANGLLEELGLEAEVVNDGLKALEAIKKSQDEPYTIILMDCQMPVMDGYEASRKIKSGEVGELSINIPIVAMTANAMDGDKEKCFAAGMDDYISKPIDPKFLEAKLKKYLLKDV